MKTTEFLRAATDEIHQALLTDMTDVPPEWLTWRPAPNVNHIGFLFWHIVRTEDEAIQRRLKQSTAIWEAEKWYEPLGLDPLARGTGFTDEQVGQFDVPLESLLAYAQRVWSSTEEFLRSLTDADLEREFSMQVPGHEPVIYTTGHFIRPVLLSHQWSHLGEIRYVKGLRGWRFMV